MALTDAATETIVYRLSSPSANTWLPRSDNRSVSNRERFLVCSSDRSGTVLPYRLDLRTGLGQSLAQTTKLDPASLTLDRSGRLLYLLDDGAVKEINVGNRHERVVADHVDMFALGGGSADTLFLKRGDAVETSSGKRIADGASEILLPDSTGQRCLFRRGSELWLASVSAPPKQLSSQSVSAPFWSPDEMAVLFLEPDENRARIMQVDVAGTGTTALSKTAPFAAFAPNANATVFVAASRSKAQPLLTLLLRSPMRELPLCEHHATRPANVNPVFSPDSRRVYFQTDREGRWAIYSIDASMLVEPTLTEAR